MTDSVLYRILGSLEASRSGMALPLGGQKQRAVLALLLLNANRTVTTEELVEALWPLERPGRPQTAVQGYVSQLRRTLDPERAFEVVVTDPIGYRLPVGPEQLDLYRFEQLLRRGRGELDRDRPDAAAETLAEALALFRGPPLADFTYEAWAQPEIGRLLELCLACVEQRVEADLRLGRHAELVGELEALVAEHPLREGLRAHLMLALYRSGRQSEALAAYQDARRALAEEFGLEPTRALQELERKLLLQDPSLELAAPVTSAPAVATELTLLFTDIEESTRLVHRLGAAYATVLVEHRRLLTDAIERAGGTVVDNHGDCFFATFARAVDAVEAAVAIHRALAAHAWPDELPVRVRVGLHTGAPVAVERGYVGLDVHRASRICDAAHGGQVLLSGETAVGLGDALADGVATRDLGEHRLRGIPEPERLFQLVAAGLDETFPPPRTERPDTAEPRERSILAVLREDEPAQPLVETASSLAGSHVPHELIVTRLVDAARHAPVELAGALGDAASELSELRAELGARAVDARVAAFTSTAPGDDVVRLASEQAVDLVLLVRAHEELSAGALDADLQAAFASAPCDVAACLFRPEASDSDVVLVPFGGGAHDWAALELSAWLASANGWRLRLLGIAGDPRLGQRDASRLLAAASLAVQQLVRVATEPVLLPAGAEPLLEAAAEGRMLVMGVPEDWRERGLGRVRSALAARAPVTTLFVRRGVRPGGLAPGESHTRFTWSLADVRVRV